VIQESPSATNISLQLLLTRTNPGRVGSSPPPTSRSARGARCCTMRIWRPLFWICPGTWTVHSSRWTLRANRSS